MSPKRVDLISTSWFLRAFEVELAPGSGVDLSEFLRGGHVASWHTLSLDIGEIISLDGGRYVLAVKGGAVQMSEFPSELLIEHDLLVVDVMDGARLTATADSDLTIFELGR